ncbi:MAG: hypothetical protein A4E40_00375 [Methanoregulaceae archaeon PtaU1.Bin059]|nr:MAG: hypothetical protein A4E40_00375 [Methanoregulaceae archaeon PtaU1.Bin059]
MTAPVMGFEFDPIWKTVSSSMGSGYPILFFPIHRVYTVSFPCTTATAIPGVRFRRAIPSRYRSNSSRTTSRGRASSIPVLTGLPGISMLLIEGCVAVKKSE